MMQKIIESKKILGSLLIIVILIFGVTLVKSNYDYNCVSVNPVTTEIGGSCSGSWGAWQITSEKEVFVDTCPYREVVSKRTLTGMRDISTTAYQATTYQCESPSVDSRAGTGILTKTACQIEETKRDMIPTGSCAASPTTTPPSVASSSPTGTSGTVTQTTATDTGNLTTVVVTTDSASVVSASLVSSANTRFSVSSLSVIAFPRITAASRTTNLVTSSTFVENCKLYKDGTLVSNITPNGTTTSPALNQKAIFEVKCDVLFSSSAEKAAAAVKERTASVEVLVSKTSEF